MKTSKPKINYMIRCRRTGMFSPGGQYALNAYNEGRWTKGGKCWTSMGALKNHLRQFIETRYIAHPAEWERRPVETNTIPLDWEVVQFEIVQKPIEEVLVARNLMPGA